jgi:Predicted ATPase
MANRGKSQWVNYVLEQLRPVRFRGGILDRQGAPVSRTTVASCIYEADRNAKRGLVDDVWDTVRLMAPDSTAYSHLIGTPGELVWDARRAEWSQATDDLLHAVYRASVSPDASQTAAPRQFLMDLAQGDAELADDYLTALAPLLLERKPAGVIWFIGDGANGKSSLIDIIYRLFPRQLVSLTTSAIEDGRATPALNGALGNIVRESSEGRVDDSEGYKAIGTHELFQVRRFHSQEMIDVNPQCHSVFNANNVPVFADKTKGARRRTLVVPFLAHFADDPEFESRTFTPQFLSGFLSLLADSAHAMRERGYRYQWSDATMKAKEAYDSEVNSVEAYIGFLKSRRVGGFTNYQLLRINYEMWCGQQGFVPLGVTTLKRTVTNLTVPRRSTALVSGRQIQTYIFAGQTATDLEWLDNGLGVAIDRQKVIQQTRLGNEW